MLLKVKILTIDSGGKPVVFLPFLKLVKTHSKFGICPICELPSEGNYCNRCGTKLLRKQ